MYHLDINPKDPVAVENASKQLKQHVYPDVNTRIAMGIDKSDSAVAGIRQHMSAASSRRVEALQAIALMNMARHSKNPNVPGLISEVQKNINAAPDANATADQIREFHVNRKLVLDKAMSALRSEFKHDPLLKSIKDNPWGYSDTELGQAFSDPKHSLWATRNIDPSRYTMNPDLASYQYRATLPNIKTPTVPTTTPKAVPTPVASTGNTTSFDKIVSPAMSKLKSLFTQTIQRPLDTTPTQATNTTPTLTTIPANVEMSNRGYDPKDPASRASFLAEPDVASKAVSVMSRDPQIDKLAPGADAGTKQQVAKSIWNQLPDHYKWMIYGGVSLGAIYAISKLFSSNDEDEEEKKKKRNLPEAYAI
jgi:hypothetical protein